MVPLTCHSPDVSINLLSLFTCSLVYVKASKVSWKLGLDYGNSYLSPDSNTYLGNTSSNTCLLHTLCQPIVSPHHAILPPEVRGDHSTRGRLAEEDLA